MQTTPSPVTIIKDNSEGEEKQDKPKSPPWKVDKKEPKSPPWKVDRKEDIMEKTKKDKDTENKAPKVVSVWLAQFMWY